MGIIPARAGFTAGRRFDGPLVGDHPRSRGVYVDVTAYSSRDLGSSPLARGLPARRRRPARRFGIIPARAGFTTSCPWLEEPRRDHPRSRGVYGRKSNGRDAQEGSSPLARGLLRGRFARVPGGRIIPARAGFTHASSPHRRSATDHPRSRGVYVRPNDSQGVSVGSSPLARGLPLADLPLALVDGIIPARAGFTTANQISHVRVKDHPRSRGVYARSDTFNPFRYGSSPLARGLHDLQPERVPLIGIIPARAGFTVDEILNDPRSTDHPRSRGVYVIPKREGVRAEGSSPLARGLPLEDSSCSRSSRIIPARAGFTARAARDAARARDHPRSRGVYKQCRQGSACQRGSSPLARGLPPGHEEHGRWLLDHPRSRGVYLLAAPSPSLSVGSSPLARGLRVRVSAGRPSRGIIPARAGFTRCHRGRAGSHRDHPRSRGVYLHTDSHCAAVAGSSPLARGLRRVRQPTSPGTGIIPARAGFTLGDRRDSNGGPPYQGAFAFTGDLGTARLSCGSVVAGQRSTTTPSPV